MSRATKTADAIAREVLRIDTLETRKSDGLDFHEVSVWELREALERAYEAGREEGAVLTGTEAEDIVADRKIDHTKLER